VSCYELAPAAQADLEEIIDYVARSSGSDVADHVLSTILSALDRIAESPRIGHSRDDLAPEPMLFWTVYSYMIVYRPGDEPLQVARIYHGARAPWRIANSNRAREDDFE